MKTKKLLILLTLLAMLLTALPTTAQDEPTLTYYVTDDGAFAAILLEGWVAMGSREEGLFIATSEETLALVTSDDDSAMPSDQYAILVVAGPIDDVEEWDALAFIAELVGAIADPDIETELSEAYEIEVDGRTFARIDATNESTDAIALAYEIAPGTWGAAFLFAAPGEGETNAELGLALLNTVAYSLPLEDTIEGADGTEYLVPAGWVGGESEGFFQIANNQEALEAGDLESGQFGIALFRWDGVDVEDTANSILDNALEEGQTAQPSIFMTVGEQEVLLVAIRDEDDRGLGGLLVMDGPEGEPDFVAIYGSAPGETYLIGLTALNMLLFSQVPAETD